VLTAGLRLILPLHLQEQLEEIFGEVGPLKQCFLVNDKESAAPRGFAFVK
jgi:RNA recognition motif-containing protein